MKKWLAVLMAACVAMAATWVQAANEAADDNTVTHEQLADLMTKALGLVKDLPSPATSQQKFAILMQNGIAPEGGWEMGKIASLGDLVRVLVQGMGLEDEVENPEDYGSWLQVLEENGISLGDLQSDSRQTVMDEQAIPTVVSQNYEVMSTDPLVANAQAARGYTEYTTSQEVGTRMHEPVKIQSLPVQTLQKVISQPEKSSERKPEPPTPTAPTTQKANSQTATASNTQTSGQPSGTGTDNQNNPASGQDGNPSGGSEGEQPTGPNGEQPANPGEQQPTGPNGEQPPDAPPANN